MPNGIQTRRIDLPMQLREMPVTSVDAEKRTATLTWTAGAQVKRARWVGWDDIEYYLEELSLDPRHVRMDRLQSGNAPLLDNHDNGWLKGLRAQIGVIESAAIGPNPEAVVRFSKRDDVEPIFRDVQDKIIRNVSVGYVVHRYEKIPPKKDGDLPIWRAVDWEPFELSLVVIPADPKASVRGGNGQPDPHAPVYPCEFITPVAAAAGQPSNTPSTRQEPHMPQANTGTTAPAADPNAGGVINEAEVRAAAQKAERDRVQEIRSRCGAAGLTREFEDRLINDGVQLADAYRAIIDEVAKKQTATPVATRAQVVEDERIKLRTAISSALQHRANPRGELPNNGAGDFRYMSLQRMGEEVLNREGVNTRGMSAMEMCGRALHSTSDFANILLDAANKRLRQAYVENMPTYTRWARRAPNAPDFKNINVVQLSNAPDLLKVLEGGEFKSGSMSDGKETYQVFTYGRIIGISRQAMVNDDLSAFDRTPLALANASRRLENRTVYNILSGTGSLADGGQLFNVNPYTGPAGSGHANYSTGTGSALAAASLVTGRAAMRVQKGYQNEELNIAPVYLIAPAALEQTAYQFTSSQYVPASSTGINEFRQGGRTALEPIIEAYLDGTTNGTTAWYLAANGSQVDTIEYCYLEGSEGLYLESRIGFDVDGIQLKARLDFAAAPIDFRGLWKAKGAA